MKSNPKIIAVDFDGTLCVNKFPDIGEPIEKTIRRFNWEKEQGSKMILHTCREAERLSEALTWCEQQGLVFDIVNDNLPESVELFGGSNSRKIFANEYWDDRNVRLSHLVHPDEEKTDMACWARREIDVACEAERDASADTGEWDYGVACYESAYSAFTSLLGDGHSGYSIEYTKYILNRLIDCKPLTPIVDDDNWNLISDKEDGTKKYQSQRMSSLFKTVHQDGSVTFIDVDMVVCVDIHTGARWSTRLVTNIIHELYPITLPYSPPDGPIRVYCEDFLAFAGNGDFDTKGVFYALLQDGSRVEINKFFTEDSLGDWQPITLEQYNRLKGLAEELALQDIKGCSRELHSL